MFRGCFTALVLVFFGGFCSGSLAAGNCVQEQLSLAFAAPQPESGPSSINLPLNQLKRMTNEKKLEALKGIDQRARDLKTVVTRTSSNLTTISQLYAEIGEQIPKQGYVRAVETKELLTILREGQIGRFYDFSFKDVGGRVGHGGNFIFIICKSCRTDDFVPGQYGSSVLNSRPLKVEELEVIVPSIPSGITSGITSGSPAESSVKALRRKTDFSKSLQTSPE